MLCTSTDEHKLQNLKVMYASESHLSNSFDFIVFHL
jgi:hypothetical protein